MGVSGAAQHTSSVQVPLIHKIKLLPKKKKSRGEVQSFN